MPWRDPVRKARIVGWYILFIAWVGRLVIVLGRVYCFILIRLGGLVLLVFDEFRRFASIMWFAWTTDPLRFANSLYIIGFTYISQNIRYRCNHPVRFTQYVSRMID
jgi:hypothetical protein